MKSGPVFLSTLIVIIEIIIGMLVFFSLNYPIIIISSSLHLSLVNARFNWDLPIPGQKVVLDLDGSIIANESYTTQPFGKDALDVYPKTSHFSYINTFSQTQRLRILEFKNQYFSSDSLLFRNNVIYKGHQRCFYMIKDLMKQWENVEMDVVAYEKAISINHRVHGIAHFIGEEFPTFAAFPKDVLTSSIIIVKERRFLNMIRSALSELNVPKENVIFHPVNQVLYARTLYTADPIICAEYRSLQQKQIRNLLERKYNMTNVMPYRFVLYNRNETRSIRNFRNISDEIRRKWPGIQWEESIIDFSTLKTVFYFFRTVKFFFCVHGAVISNTYFMIENTVICELQGNLFINHFFMLSYINFHYHIYARHLGISHRGTQSTYIEPELVIGLIEKGLTCLQ